MTIGITLPSGRPDLGDNAVDALVELTGRAAAAGLASVWFTQRNDYDALSVAAVAGRAVAELEIGTAVVPIYPRHPLVVASQAQTAQAAGHGRFTLGLGLGVPARLARNTGVDTSRPIRHLREYLTVLNRLADTGEVDVEGETVTARTAGPMTVPGASARVPVVVAAMGPQALRVTGELADGTLPYLAGPRTLEQYLIPTITAAAEAAGRPAPRIIAAIPATLTGEVDRVRELAYDQMAFYAQVPSYQAVLEREGVAHPADLAVIGDEGTLADAVRRYTDAGATEILVANSGLAGPQDRQRTWEFLGSLNG